MAASHFLVHSTTIEVFSWGEVNTAINQIISRHRTFAWPSTKLAPYSVSRMPKVGISSNSFQRKAVLTCGARSTRSTN